MCNMCQCVHACIYVYITIERDYYPFTGTLTRYYVIGFAWGLKGGRCLGFNQENRLG